MYQQSLTETFKSLHLKHLWGLEDFPYHSADLHQYCLLQLNAYSPNATHPLVYVAISQSGDCLRLSFFIEKKSWVNLNSFQKENFDRQDFLWEDHCLECFVELSNDTEYLEANVSTNGAYNLYRFDNYRSPNTMPPVQDRLAMLFPEVERSSALENWYQYHWTIKLAEYRPFYIHQRHKACIISKINPCVILYFDKEGKKQPIYYAVNHANPPDFHNKNYWLNFK